MALIKCRECGKEFSDMAAACPNCGYSLSVKKGKKGKIGCFLCGIAVMLFVFMILFAIALPQYFKAVERVRGKDGHYIKQALDIVYTETKDKDFNSPFGGTDIRFLPLIVIKGYLNNQEYLNNMECTVLDESDVNGTKHTNACLLRGVNKDEEKASDRDVLVKAYNNVNNKDIIELIFFSKAQKTEKGFSYNTILPFGVAVNLNTRKISQL